MVQRATRRALLWWGVGCFVASVALGLLIVTLEGGDPFIVDVWWNTQMADWRQPALLVFARAMNTIGGSWVAVFVIPLVSAALLALVRRPRSAVYALAAFAASALIVQVLKHLFGRARPEDMLVLSDFGSFPSGHTANAATIAVVAWVLFPRRWVAIAGVLWALLMAWSRTLLSVHWLTDTIGGELAGASVALLLAAWLLPWLSPEVGARTAVARGAG